VRVWQPDAEAVHARYATGERPYWSGVKRTANGEQCERRRGVWLGRRVQVRFQHEARQRIQAG
jgi:hypothetical protein